MEKKLMLGILFDGYGKLLTKTQIEIMNDYLNNDLTLSEIAQNKGVTRQAVKDMAKKAEIKLTKLESELGFIAKIEELKKGN